MVSHTFLQTLPTPPITIKLNHVHYSSFSWKVASDTDKCNTTHIGLFKSLNQNTSIMREIHSKSVIYFKTEISQIMGYEHKSSYSSTMI